MWIEELKSGGYKFSERYKDPMSETYKKVSVNLKSNSNQAKKQAQQILTDKIAKKTKQKSSDVRFGPALDEWLEYYKNTVKQSTFISISTTINTVKKYIDPNTLLRNITALTIKEIVEKAYYDDNYSLNYVKKIKSIYTAVLRRNLELGHIDSVPSYRMNLKLRQEKKVDKYLEKWEVREIIDQLRKREIHDRKADMVEFMVLTGVRYGELIAIKDSNIIDGKLIIDGTIDFRAYQYGQAQKTSPKTSAAYRTIGLSERALEIIKKVQEENEFNKLTKIYIDQGFLFTNRKGSPIDYRLFNAVLSKAVKDSGIDKQVTSHYFRHTHVSMLAELGVDIKSIMDRIGHTDASTTLEIYSHVTDKMKTTTVDKLNTIEF